MFENIGHFFKRIVKEPQKELGSKDAAKERLHLVLMQDRANVSADFLELMKQDIIDVIKKYIVVDEDSIDVRLTNQAKDDGTNGAPSLYANIPIVNIKNDMMAEKIKDFEGVDFNKEMGIPTYENKPVEEPAQIEEPENVEEPTVIELPETVTNVEDKEEKETDEPEEEVKELFEEVDEDDDDDDDVTFDDLLKAAEEAEEAEKAAEESMGASEKVEKVEKKTTPKTSTKSSKSTSKTKRKKKK